MPDHVHFLIQPWPKENADAGNVIFWSLKESLHSIKSYSAHAINKTERERGGVWEKERFDRYIRSQPDLIEKFEYILRSPWDSGVAKPGEDYPWVWAQDDEYRVKSPFPRDAETNTRDACARRKEGEENAPQIIVGTHALLYEGVNFTNLGLAVIDEQHKFGVGQRAKLTSREPAPDVLVMTATPIPRTLTMTIYGDLEISTIDEMPRGRGEIITHLLTGDQLGEAITFLREQLSVGRQSYIIYPLIDESEKLEAKAAAKDFEVWQERLRLFRCELLHGRVASPDKQSIMQRFRAGETKALISTTVIEVGVDIPNATIDRKSTRLNSSHGYISYAVFCLKKKQRIRFEHPEIRSVIITSAKNRIFCSGANIYMLGLSSHAWKVNFCKFTNETRNGIEDASTHSGLKFIAACNGTTAGGGYELALACDEIILVDDRSSAVSLPELPLLGVLPGTGGLTRVTDKRKVRRDHADIFCTNPDGVRGQRAKEWRLVDDTVKPQQFAEHVKQRARKLAEESDRPAGANGVALTPLKRTVDEAGLHYGYVDVQCNREARTATLTVRAPESVTDLTFEKVIGAGANWWPLQMARELDDAILTLRAGELDLGLWIFKTTGNPDAVLAIDEFILNHQHNWFVREVLGMMRRTFARIDVTSRSIYAILEPGSCVAGTLLELALAADRIYMRDTLEDGNAPSMALSNMNFGPLPMVNKLSRLAARFYSDEAQMETLRGAIGKKLSAREALDAGLVTSAPDDLDWEDEIRQAIESRAAQSPDALTGLEANLRFGPAETLETRIFGRLSAWQNWIFTRPNAVGTSGALKVYGTGAPVKFNWERI